MDDKELKRLLLDHSVRLARIEALLMSVVKRDGINPEVEPVNSDIVRKLLSKDQD